MLRTRLALVLALASAALPACAGADDASTEGSEEAEENLTGGATLIAKGLGGPSHLQVVSGNLFYSTAHFVASGDPELDQQMAYWEGESWLKPLAGGTKKRVLQGYVDASVNIGKSVLYIWEGGFNVGKIAVPSGNDTNIFHVQDMSEDPQGPITSIAYGDGRAYIGQDDGNIYSVDNNGGDKKLFIKTPNHSGNMEGIDQMVVAGDQLVWATSQRNDNITKFRIFRAPLAGSTHTAVNLGDFAERASSIVSDGTRAYAAMINGDTGYVLSIPLAGSGRPTKLVSDNVPNDLVMDSSGLFYSSAKGVFMVPKASLGSTTGTVSSKRVYAAKSVNSFALSDKDLYIAISPGHPNEKKGEIHKLPRAKFPQ